MTDSKDVRTNHPVHGRLSRDILKVHVDAVQVVLFHKVGKGSGHLCRFAILSDLGI